MDLQRFDSMLVGVGDAFGKSLTPATKSQYFSMLGPLSDEQWEKTCEAAKAECEQFPRISEMIKISYRYAPPTRKAREDPTITCVCKCRNSWAWLNTAELKSNAHWRCPECHTTYSVEFLEAHREGPLIDLSGDAEAEKKKAAEVAKRVVDMLERERQF
jgi:hypothetical protein